MNRFAERIVGCFRDNFAECRVRVYGVQHFRMGRFDGFCQRYFRDQFRRFRPDDVATENFAIFGVINNFHKSGEFAHSLRFAVHANREFTDFQFVSGFPRFFLG